MEPQYEVTRIRTERAPDTDELGNDVWVETEQQVPVYGWSVPQSTEPKLAGHDRLTVDIELIAPVGVFVPRDSVKLPDWDQALEVVGKPENYSHNPFGWDPGAEIVNLAVII